MFAGMMARPAATSSRTNSGVISAGMPLRKFAEDGRRVIISDFRFPIGDLGTAFVLLVQVGAAVVLLKSPIVNWQLAIFMFSRMAMNSISGVMMPARAYCNCVTTLPAFGAQRTTAAAFESGKFHETILLRHARELGVFAGEIAVVLRLHFATVVFLDVAAFQNPVAAQRGQTFVGRAGERRIAPRPAAIIDAHGRILLDRAGVRLGVADFDLAHRHAEVGMQFAGHENFFAGGQLFAAVRFERFFGCDHKLVDSF